MVGHLVKDCALCESGHVYLRKISSRVDASALLNGKKGIEAVAKFIELLLHVLN